MKRICEWCGVEFDGRADARYCGTPHRVQAHRAQADLENGQSAIVKVERDSGTPTNPPLTPETHPKTVLWGPGSLSMSEEYPVVREALESEDEYVARNVDKVRRLVEGGLKNPVVEGKDRMDRTEEYARWRYRGFLAGEIASL